ncbi:MAG: hypothetical protein BWY82_02394 [Verrucomicrobia bacterium ADurb.Bin474]|nr:MAG: hypothetical protein BWY82_02394 [Verrucomicrobia bacterium ADurb.Bin474]
MGIGIGTPQSRKDGGGHDDVADGAESDDEDAFHGLFNSRMNPVPDAYGCRRGRVLPVKSIVSA